MKKIILCMFLLLSTLSLSLEYESQYINKTSKTIRYNNYDKKTFAIANFETRDTITAAQKIFEEGLSAAKNSTNEIKAKVTTETKERTKGHFLYTINEKIEGNNLKFNVLFYWDREFVLVLYFENMENVEQLICGLEDYLIIDDNQQKEIRTILNKNKRNFVEGENLRHYL